MRASCGTLSFLEASCGFSKVLVGILRLLEASLIHGPSCRILRFLDACSDFLRASFRIHVFLLLAGVHLGLFWSHAGTLGDPGAISTLIQGR